MDVKTLILDRPDDAHLHLRDGEHLNHVIVDTARQFKRAIVMPNLTPPVDGLKAATAYRQRILEAKAAYCPTSDFEPLMTLYLTDQTTAEDIETAKESGIIHAVKFYPVNATTNSAAGVTDIKKRYPVFKTMEKVGMVLCVHGEWVSDQTDIFDRERVFLERVLSPIMEKFPDLPIVLEHVTTQTGVEFVQKAGRHLAATITAHHLLLNRNAIFTGGLRPHHYCLPILKREKDRLSLLEAATSATGKFFLGTDSAPHAQTAKESACGCAGIYTAHAAIALYAEAFESVGKLDQLNAFASHYAADFYRLPRNKGKIKLVSKAWTVPKSLPYGKNETLIPFRADEKIAWTLESLDNELTSDSIY